MDVFDLRRQIVDDYATFARSFTRIKADDLRTQVNAIYANDQFWPEPLLQISSHFQLGASVDELSAAGEIEPTTAKILRVPDAQKWPRLSKQHSPTFKWTAGRLQTVQSCPRRRSALATMRPTRWATRGAPGPSSYAAIAMMVGSCAK